MLRCIYARKRVFGLVGDTVKRKSETVKENKSKEAEGVVWTRKE
jgi:signal peptidase I